MVVIAWPLFLLGFATAGLADPIDWVNINYVLSQAKSNSATGNAQSAIASKASGTAKNGPWTIQTKGINPPSGVPKDYLSWAPYHWPDCNWCSKGSTHYVNPNGTYDEPDDGGGDAEDSPNGDSLDGKDDTDGDDDVAEDLGSELVAANFLALPARPNSLAGSMRSFDKVRQAKRTHPRQLRDSMQPRESVEVNPRQTQDTTSATSWDDTSPTANDALIPVAGFVPIPTISPTGIPNIPQVTTIVGSSTTSHRVIGTQAPAEAPAKTQKEQCTPSPTKSLAPSATWTTCPYIVRDGKVNPDTNTLKGPDAAQDMSQSVIYNAIAYALQKSSTYSQNVANAIDAFFLSSSSGMNPNVNFGQLVRGPGKDHQIGTFTGILDLRGMVKVANAIQLMRSTNSPDWTSNREASMTSWTKTYVSWLQNSSLGKSVASKANNHLTFYTAQLAAVQTLLGDSKGAISTLQKYFTNQFLDQIAQSGEQPFEAVRTRPYHYRCFNLEAMIANAKLGDQLGQNFWTSKSKYGATIQTAVDYVMSLNPGSEEISDVFPHVAAVAAAYGDPKGKYAAFLQKTNPNYKNQPYWFFDQSAALPNSPAGKNKRDSRAEDMILSKSSDPTFVFPRATESGSIPDQPASDNDNDSGGPEKPALPFECPAVFENAAVVELEDGLFVTCDQLKPFYEILLRDDTPM